MLWVCVIIPYRTRVIFTMLHNAQNQTFCLVLGNEQKDLQFCSKPEKFHYYSRGRLFTICHNLVITRMSTSIFRWPKTCFRYYRYTVRLSFGSVYKTALELDKKTTAEGGKVQFVQIEKVSDKKIVRTSTLMKWCAFSEKKTGLEHFVKIIWFTIISRDHRQLEIRVPSMFFSKVKAVQVINRPL